MTYKHYDEALKEISVRFPKFKPEYADDLTYFYHGSDTFLFIRGHLDHDGVFETMYFVIRVKYNLDEIQFLGADQDFNKVKQLIADYVYETHIKPAQQFNEFILTDEANLWLH